MKQQFGKADLCGVKKHTRAETDTNLSSTFSTMEVGLASSIDCEGIRYEESSVKAQKFMNVTSKIHVKKSDKVIP